jgi:hypothetical protein
LIGRNTRQILPLQAPPGLLSFLIPSGPSIRRSIISFSGDIAPLLAPNFPRFWWVLSALAIHGQGYYRIKKLGGQSSIVSSEVEGSKELDALLPVSPSLLRDGSHDNREAHLVASVLRWRLPVDGIEKH